MNCVGLCVTRNVSMVSVSLELSGVVGVVVVVFDDDDDDDDEENSRGMRMESRTDGGHWFSKSARKVRAVEVVVSVGFVVVGGVVATLPF